MGFLTDSCHNISSWNYTTLCVYVDFVTEKGWINTNPRQVSAAFFLAKLWIEFLICQRSQAMIRARLLRENGKYLTAQSFAMRRHYFNNDETGYFKTQKRPPVSPNSTAMLNDLVKGNFINVLPMVVIGGESNCRKLSNLILWLISYHRMDQLDVFRFRYDKSSLSTYVTLQTDVTKRCWACIIRCCMGFVSVLVFSECIRFEKHLHACLGREQW